MKRCTGCQHSKPETEFYKNKKTPDGLEYRCKDCAKTDARNHYHKKGCPRRVSSSYAIPRGEARRRKNRQDMIVKYGLDVVEAMEVNYSPTLDDL